MANTYLKIAFGLFLIYLEYSPSYAYAEDHFKKEFSFGKFHFIVEATNNQSINRLKIIPSGLKLSNSILTKDIDGAVADARVVDIDNNGYPEVYVWFNSAGSGSYGDLIAYAVNKGKSMSEIFFPPLQEDPKNSIGYMGHDEFEIVEGALVRRFPLYDKGDTNSRPSGKMRQLQYKLVEGEASWKLKLYNSIEF